MEIYALRDPHTGEVRYIGKANCSRRRLVSHARDSQHRNTPVYVWWRALRAQGKSPVLEVLDAAVTEETWATRERELIAQHRLTAALLNVSPGGNAPYCPRSVRAQNAGNTAKARSSTPFKKHVYELKRNLMQAHRRGFLTEAVKVKLRLAAHKCPKLFYCFARV